VWQFVYLYILDEQTLVNGLQVQYRDAFKRYYPGESQVLYAASKAWSCSAVRAIAGRRLVLIGVGANFTPPQKQVLS